MFLLQKICFLFTCLCFAQNGFQDFPRDLRKVVMDLSQDPTQLDVYAVGVVQDIYIHMDVDPTILSNGFNDGEQGIVDYLLSLTDVWNRDSFNPIGFNLVLSGFSIGERDNFAGMDWHQGEHHIWLHLSDYCKSSNALMNGLYDGEDRSWALIHCFAGARFTHLERTNGPHEIGHLFGLEESHNYAGVWAQDVDESFDYCGNGPRGPECSSKPGFGGNLMSYCHLCPGPSPLTQFHRFSAAKIQQRFRQSGPALADISFEKLRNFIPSQASNNRCAREGQDCHCNGVVYYGPTISQSSTKIFSVAQVSGSVRCASGADQEFTDVFHRSSKSCYCDRGAIVRDVSYAPTSVEFTSVGRGPCDFECDNSWGEDCKYEVYHDQPEWKCKQECLDKRACVGYNWSDGDCRLYENVRHINDPDHSGDYSNSFCWRRPTGEAAWPRPQRVERDISRRVTTSRPLVTGPVSTSEPYVTTTTTPAGAWSLWAPWSSCTANCGGTQSRWRRCFDQPCFGDSSQTRDCDTRGDCPGRSTTPRPTRPSTTNSRLITTTPRPTRPTTTPRLTTTTPRPTMSDCRLVAVAPEGCPQDELSLPNCSDNMRPGQLCEADLRLQGSDKIFVIANCGSNDVFRLECSALQPQTTQPTTTKTPEWDRWTAWSECSRSCSSGVQTRTRACKTSGCVGADSQTRHCNTQRCPQTTSTPGNSGFQNVGLGLCRSPSDGGVGGMIHFRKTQNDCRSACESRRDCIGFSAINSQTRSSTCYIYGPYHSSSRPQGWYGASGHASEIGQSNGLDSMVCYKRV